MARTRNLLKARINNTSEPIYEIHQYGIDIANNQIFLFGWQELAGTAYLEGEEPGVEFSMANRFIFNANICMKTNSGTPLMVHQKTNGGDWTEGMAIFDQILNYPSPTTVLSYTHARSMSSITFQAATKRVMMPGSYFMFHDGTYGDHGTLKSMRSGFEFHDKSSDTMLDIYAHRMSQKGKYANTGFAEIKKLLRKQMDKTEEVYLTPLETVEYGLADEVFDGNWDKLIKYPKQQTKDHNEYQIQFQGGYI